MTGNRIMTSGGNRLIMTRVVRLVRKQEEDTIIGALWSDIGRVLQLGYQL